MKKQITLLLCACTLLTAFAGCGGTTDDPNTLNIVCLDKGYGSTWINTIARQFEAENEGITVKVNCSAKADELIEKNLASRYNTDDLYICVGGEWKMNAVRGKFAQLDDIMDDLVDGVSLKEKVADEYENSVYYPDSNGVKHTYRLPWTAGVGGIFYNEKMFEANDWEIPQTYEELVTLCATIVNDKVEVGDGTRTTVKPFVYTSANTDYFDYTVYTWWSQLAGVENVKAFMQYDSPDNFDVAKSDTYAKLKDATKMLTDLFCNTSYVHEAESNHDAQKDFNNGYAAMMLNGEWVYNEIKGYKIENEDFNLAVMKTPTATNAIKAGEGGDATYTIGEDQYIAVPASSTKQELAKKFIKLLVSDFGCKTFIDQANGLLAYDITTVSDSDISSVTQNGFMQNLYAVKKSYTDGAFTNYPDLSQMTNVRDHNAMIYLANNVDIWGTGTMRPYRYIMDGTWTIDKAFSEIALEVSSNWASWQTNSGVNK